VGREHLDQGWCSLVRAEPVPDGDTRDRDKRVRCVHVRSVGVVADFKKGSHPAVASGIADREVWQEIDGFQAWITLHSSPGLSRRASSAARCDACARVAQQHVRSGPAGLGHQAAFGTAGRQPPVGGGMPEEVGMEAGDPLWWLGP
jgi:hypothetical protein